MKVRYNAPTVLTFTLICVIVMLLSEKVIINLNLFLFAVPGKDHFNPANIRNWITLFTHIIGHGNWTHLIGNFTLILLIGPILEEIYGSLNLFIMIVITAGITGVINALFFTSALMGASGVVFMMILLSSFTNFSKGEVPLTFILVLILYMGVQLLSVFNDDNIAYFAHIVGGLCGSFFGFLHPGRRI